MITKRLKLAYKAAKVLAAKKKEQREKYLKFCCIAI
jgi:hypothetical protein